MKGFFRFLLLVAVSAGIIYVLRKMLTPAENEFARSGGGVLPQQPIKSLDDAPLGGEVSPELLKILVCPEDKGSLELVDDGKFLLNPRNGYKYPIRNGIPVMLIEEGKKYRDPSFAGGNGAGQPA
jgi:uncharacterized protein YbaR (Trm112 family)